MRKVTFGTRLPSRLCSILFLLCDDRDATERRRDSTRKPTASGATSPILCYHAGDSFSLSPVTSWDQRGDPDRAALCCGGRRRTPLRARGPALLRQPAKPVGLGEEVGG